MPCDSVFTFSLDLKVADLDRMKRALDAEGIECSLDTNGKTLRFYVDGCYGQISNGKVTYRSTERLDETALANRFRRAYSEQTIKDSAKRFKWGLKKTGEGRFVAQKRL
jgi:hypothetical protein